MNLEEESQKSGIPDEALLLKYIIDEVTTDERLKIEAWIRENSENEKVILQLAQIYHAQRTEQRIRLRDTDFAFGKVQSKINKKMRYMILRRASIAASLIIGILGIGSFIFQYSQLPKDVKPSLITVQSNRNQRSLLMLPDGTEVHLNSGSALTYPTNYSDKERNVQLVGEAYFKVAHNAQKPFVVSVSDNKLNVKVLGTEFNLQAYKEKDIVQTTLVKGSIQLNIQGERTHTILTPSEKAIYNIHENQLRVLNVNTERETDWMYDRVVFKDTPMSEVLAQLSRFYSVEFDVKNKIINTYTFTGTFEDKPLFQVLDYMKISSNINYTITYVKDENGTKSVVRLTK